MQREHAEPSKHSENTQISAKHGSQKSRYAEVMAEVIEVMKEQIMKKPVVCVGVLVRRADARILIVQTTKWRGLWGIAGGKVEWGETLEQAARREIREETGLVLDRCHYVQTQEAVLSEEFGRPAHMLLIDFVGFCVDATPQVVPNEEIVDWHWCLPHEALHDTNRPLNSYTRRLLEVVQGEKSLLAVL